jgi:hypothetical protein
MTRGGAGIETATDTYRSTRSRKSSTVSSASGRELKDLSIDRIYASIADQQRELTYYRKKPAWVLMSPRTGYELQSETRDWVYLGTPDPPGSKPMIMIMGIPLRTEAWMPDGIVVVTDTYEDVPLVRWSGMSYDWSDILPKGDPKSTKVVSELWKSYITDTSAPSTSFYFDTTKASTTTTIDTTSAMDITWWTDGTIIFDKATVSGAVIEPESWAEVIEESQEPDPESIYGKALARARVPYKRDTE